jgi:hypothetical protein
MPIIDTIASAMGGNIAEGVAKIIGLFKIDPTIALSKQVELQEIQLKMQADAAAAVAGQVQTQIVAAGEIIKAEANSQSWLPRNVRPLLLLLWGSMITLNALVPVIARFWIPTLLPFPLDAWIYKLTAIGFTGYVTARTWEKATGTDN